MFELKMEVRDYECDIQGIVNNSVYQNYLEHARHKFLHSINLDFAQLHNEGLDAVVTRVEIDYKYSLRPRDLFGVRIRLRKRGNLRFVFEQQIVRLEDEKLIVKAEVTGVLTKNGRPIAPAVFDEALLAAGLDVMTEK
ncbi:acyl-CoA thioesterase [Prolixibacteraceae bacterium JC049]|nr:acyl-CoA thioesterase [Prolixibacteraceae bacterium JC049]